MKRMIPALCLILLLCACRNEAKDYFNLGVEAMQQKEFAAAVEYFKKAEHYREDDTAEYLGFSQEMLDKELALQEQQRLEEQQKQEELRLAEEKKAKATETFSRTLESLGPMLEAIAATCHGAVEALDIKPLNTIAFKKDVADARAAVAACEQAVADGAGTAESDLRLLATAKAAADGIEKVRKAVESGAIFSTQGSISALMDDLNAATVLAGEFTAGLADR